MLDEILYKTDWRLGPHIFQKYPPGGDGISMGIVQIRLAIRIILAAGEN